LSAVDPAGLTDVARKVAAQLEQTPGRHRHFRRLPPPGVDWEIKVDRSVAARYGIGPSSVGTVVQLVTTGLKLTDYRPAGADDAVDIRLRLPEDRRTLSTLDDLRIETSAGFGPDLEFRHPRAGRKRWNADRIDGVRTITVSAGISRRHPGRSVASGHRRRTGEGRSRMPPASAGSWRVKMRSRKPRVPS
jgi:multidrug efflux pump